MRTLTSADILQVWEQAAALPPLERALIMLRAACPESTCAQLADMDLGQRDAQLWKLRELTFGAQLAAFTQCPSCQERLEFTLDVSSLRPPSSAALPSLELATAAGRLRFRLPTSTDLRAIDGLDLAQAQRALAQRCVIAPAPPEQELSEHEVLELSQCMQQHMPGAEVTLTLTCPACRHAWQPWLDVVGFLWNEIAAQARRSLREVHLLANAYGWHEADILALSPLRRQAYLGMLS